MLRFCALVLLLSLEIRYLSKECASNFLFHVAQNSVGQLPRVSGEAYAIDLTLTLKLKYLVLIWIY